MVEKIIQIQLIRVELTPPRAEFFKRCCQYEDEIMKLLECGFFECELGRIFFDKANRKIREAEMPKKFKWAK